MPRKVNMTSRRKTAEESVYLRRARPVNVRRGAAAWMRLVVRWALPALVVAGVAFGVLHSMRRYLATAPAFTFGTDGPRVTGLRFVGEPELRMVFEMDRGRSLAAIPIEERRVRLLEMPWVEEAHILRVWPNQLWVHIEERQPIAWMRDGGTASKDFSSPRLIDRHGVFLDPPVGFDLDLPVASGIDEGMPMGERRIRVALLENLLEELGTERAKLSEIDVADSSNARVLTLHEGDIVELQMGAEAFRHRWDVFQKYVPSWKEKYGRIGSVDLRFEGQVAISRVDF